MRNGTGARKAIKMLEKVIDHIFAIEGGFANHPNDKGGPTNLGITQATLAAYRGHAVSVDDVRLLSRMEATEIYRKNFWNKMNLDLVTDWRVQMCLMDQGVHRGPRSAATQAQVVLNALGVRLVADGDLGTKTAGALNELNGELFAREFIQASQLYYADLVVRKPTQLVFLKGWLNRSHRLEDQVWLGKAATAPIPDPKPEESRTIVTGKNPMAPYMWARAEVGHGEVAGSKHNPRIVWYHSFTKLKATDDETNWCSSFICAAAEENGYPSTDSAAARSWLTYGEEGDGSEGDIAVFWRGSKDGWKGHVAFVAKKFLKGETWVSCLGGNQSNRVCVKQYEADQLLGFRRFPAS
jgi:uncharacterized protein (TIGR02594 family)